MTVNPATLSLESIVDIVVEISPLSAPRATFNQMLIVGPSVHIPSVGAGVTRIREYQSLTGMIQDNFAITDPEYIAAGLYFDQDPPPLNLWVGRQDLTALSAVAPTTGELGTNYALGDIITVTQGSANLGTAVVTAIGSDGSVSPTGLQVIQGAAGTGYSLTSATGLTTSTNSLHGTGLEVTITAIGETPLIALMNCRTANFQWYVGMVTDSVKADHIACAGWAQSAQPSTRYAYTTADADVPTGTAGNVLLTLQGLEYGRVTGQYSTQSLYAIASIMGYAMGQSSMLANSAFTLKFKGEVGILTEPLTPTEIFNIESANGNLYLSYGNYYNIFEQGVNADGTFFDEGLYLDMLTNNLQLSVMDLLFQTPKVPQTDAGMTSMLSVCNVACQQSVTQGFLAPGIWDGPDVLNLHTGDMLPKGYLCQSPPYSQQAPADRQARKSSPIYICVKEAGAVHSVVIQLNVNR